MVSRLKHNPATIFDVFVEMGAPCASTNLEALVLRKYPDDFNDERTLKHIAEFAFPCKISDEAVQLFSFVLTNEQGKYTFGYCRHAPKSNTCLCFLSALPWSELFYKFLNHIAAVMNSTTSRGDEIEALLVRAYHQEIPSPGHMFVVDSSLGRNKMECICPDDSKLPRIPDNRHLTEYYNAVDDYNMRSVWASMLYERRIIFISNKLGRLSSCVIAANMLIYPMHWQHIFVPVLPEHIFYMLNAPMPFLIGVSSVSYAKALREIDLSEVVVLNVDTKEFKSPFNDVASLPTEVTDVLKKNLKNSNHLLGDGVSRSFLRAMVVLIGGYREGLNFRPGEMITFDKDKFVSTRPPPIQPFLEKLRHMQIFEQFVSDRLRRLNGEGSCRDEFEEECTLYSGRDNSKMKYHYQHYVGNVKKDLVKTFQDRANPAVIQQAVEKVKNKGKDTFKDFKDKLNEIKVDTTPPLKKLDLLSSGLRKNQSASSIPSVSDVSNDDVKTDLYKYEQLITVEPEHPKLSNVDLLQEMEQILAQQTPILAALEKQNYDNRVANGRIKGAKSAERLFDLNDSSDGEMFKKCAVNRSKTAMGFARDETTIQNERSLIDFGPSYSSLRSTNVNDVIFDPLLDHSTSSSASNYSNNLSLVDDQSKSIASSTNVDLLAEFFGPTVHKNKTKNAPTINGSNETNENFNFSNSPWEKFE